MSQHRKPRLRIHTEGSDNRAAEQPRCGNDEVLDCLVKFAKATGWGVTSSMKKYQSILSEDGMPPAHLGMKASQVSGASRSRWELTPISDVDGALDHSDNAAASAVAEKDASALLDAIEKLVGRLERAENAVRQQQAQLATEVSISRQKDDEKEIADRFEAILASSCRSIQADAAAIYLLDDATSELKMRASWNLPIDRLMAPARSLRGSLADLEALLGNAVLIEDTRCSPSWPSPEDFASAVVVPIGSVSMPHGTIWFWSNRVRSYTFPEVEVANMASGRVMSELEQAVLGVEVRNSRTLNTQVDQASIAQAARWPTFSKMHKDFGVSGWSMRESDLGGAFHDWDIAPNENLVCMFGDCPTSGPQGAIVAASIHAITRSSWSQLKKPADILQSIGDYLFMGGEDDWQAHTSLLQLDMSSGRGCLATAGNNQIFIVSDRGLRPIGTVCKPLATSPGTQLQNNKFVLQPGEVLIGISGNLVEQLNLPAGIHSNNRSRKQSSEAYNRLRRERRALSRTLDQHPLLHEVKEMLDEEASEIARHIASRLPTLVSRDGEGADRSLLVVRNGTKACSFR